jgi:hypothetical protein
MEVHHRGFDLIEDSDELPARTGHRSRIAGPGKGKLNGPKFGKATSEARPVRSASKADVVAAGLQPAHLRS